jgi:hypothetical protein
MILDGKKLPKKGKFFPAAAHGTLGRRAMVLRPSMPSSSCRAASTFCLSYV